MYSLLLILSSVNQKRLPSPTGTTSPMRFETRGPEKQSRERVFNAANVLKATLVSPRSKVASPRPRVGNQTEIIMIHHTATPSGSHTAGTQNSSANNSNVSSILATKADKPLDQKPKEERPASPSGTSSVFVMTSLIFLWGQALLKSTKDLFISTACQAKLQKI